MRDEDGRRELPLLTFFILITKLSLCEGEDECIAPHAAIRHY
jgi:hypothetical protein